MYITTTQAIRRAVRARAHGHSVDHSADIAVGRRLRRGTATAERGAVKAARAAAGTVRQTYPVAPLDPRVALARRLEAHIVARWEPVIAARGGETGIETDRGSLVGLDVVARHRGYVLLRAQGYRAYGRRTSWHASVVYLCGRDDSGRWAVRVPGTLRTITAALDWVTPAAVREAAAAGKRVLRQGDVYAIECRRDLAGRTAAAALPASHTWDAAARTLAHGEHAPLHVPFPCRLVRQRVLAMGRGRGRAAGD